MSAAFEWPKWPVYAEDEIEASSSVLRSGRVNYWTGEEGRMFESEMCQYAGTKYGVALANGTLALELAFIALGMPKGDVVVTPRSFMASASSIVVAGHRPVFADVDPDSGNISAKTIEAALTPDTRAIVPVHLAGWPCDMVAIRELAREKGIAVIEDCAQAHGAKVEGRSVGSFSDVSVWSFCQDKIMSTCGEGGFLMTDDEQYWRRAWEYKDHGKSFDAVYHREHPIGYRWLHETFGSNWRLTEPQSAVARVQLRKLDDWVAKRTENASVFVERLKQLSALRVPLPSKEFTHSFYRLYVYVRPECLAEGWNRDRIMAEVNALGVPCFTGTCGELYKEKAFVDAGYGLSQELPVAAELSKTSLMLLCHPTLTVEHMHRMADAIEKVVCQASR